MVPITQERLTKLDKRAAAEKANLEDFFSDPSEETQKTEALQRLAIRTEEERAEIMRQDAVEQVTLDLYELAKSRGFILECLSFVKIYGTRRQRLVSFNAEVCSGPHGDVTQLGIAQNLLATTMRQHEASKSDGKYQDDKE